MQRGACHTTCRPFCYAPSPRVSHSPTIDGPQLIPGLGWWSRPTPTILQGGAKVQPLSAAMPPSGPGSAPDSGPVRPDPPVLRRCRPASSLTVLGSLVVDVLLIMIPMTVGLLPPLPQPARLALVLVALATLVLVVTNHALRGRSLGGALLGLRAVDIDAGLPPASLRSILAALRLGSAADVVIVSTRRGPDPTQGTLADLERTPALTSSPTPTEPAPVRGPETAYSTSPSHPAHPDGQYSAPLTGRPAAAPVPAAGRPVSAPPDVPTPTSARPPSLPPSIPVQRPHPPAPGPDSSRAQQHTHPQISSDTVEIQPIRATSPRPEPGDFPPSPPPPPAPSSQQVL